MSEEKVERTLNDVQQDYLKAAAQAGEMQYKAVRLSKDLEVVNKILLDLNLEAASIQARDATRAAEAAKSEQKEESVNA